MVIEVLKILTGRIDECRTVYLNKQVKSKNRLLVPCNLEKRNPKCYVCGDKPEVTVYFNTDTVTVKQLEEKLLKEKLGMVAPDLEIDDGKGTILISSEEGETEGNWHKVLSAFNIKNSTRLKVDDFLQNYELVIIVRHKTDIEAPALFLLEGEIPVAKPIPEEEKPQTAGENGSTTNMRKRKLSAEQSDTYESKKKKMENETTVENDDDIVVIL